MHKNRRRAKPRALLVAAVGCTGMLASPAMAQNQESDQPIEEITVTGSYIQRSSFDSASPLDVLGQDDFSRQGAISVKDIAQNLTYNLGSENFPDTLRSGATTGTENINLRGLGVNSTLVLMNGRRQAEAPNLTNDGVAFVDTASMMPTIAIERMEVLKDGAAALYGSDAISGVVNFITRSDFEGFELQVDNQTITESEDFDRPMDWSLQGIMGFGNERGHVMAAASLLDRSAMPMYAKDFTFAGGLSSFGAPGSVFAAQGAGESDAAFATRRAAFQATTLQPGIAGGADLDCENVPHAQGSPGDNGTRPVSLLLASADRCLVDFLPTQSIIDAERRINIFAQGNYLLIPEHEIEVFAEFHAATNEVKRANSPTFGFVSAPTVGIENPGLRNDAFRRGLGGEELINDGAAQALGFANATEAARANPLVGPMITAIRPFAGVPEEVYKNNGRVDNVGLIERDKTHFVAGLRGNIPEIESWTFEASATWSEHQFAGFTAFDTNDPNMKAALAGFGGRDCRPETTAPGDAAGNCLFFNPFGSSYLADPSDVGPNGLYNPDELFLDMLDPILTLTEQDLFVVEGVVTGNLFEMPAGSLGVAFGAQFRDQRFSSVPSGTGSNFDFSFVVGQEPFNVERDVWAVFAEALVPITDAGSALGALELSLALRFEEYGGGTGNTTDPKISFLWMPTNDLSVRGSYQTSFKAPGLAQLGGSSTSLNNIQQNPFDPASARVFVPGIAVGNPNLAPEEADVYNIGFTWRPSEGALEGLGVNFDFWSFEFENAIKKESNNAVIAAFVAGDPEAAAKLTLDSLGNISVVRSAFINAASVDTRGFDLGLTYGFDVEGFGNFDLFYNMTFLETYDFQEAPGSPKVDGLGKRNFQTIGAPAPEWRANSGVDWFMGNHSANLTLRYTTDYEMSRPPSALVAGFNNRTPDGDIDEHLTVDVQYSYELMDVFGATGPTTLSLGAINLFDEEPPRLDDGPGFDSKIHDPRGRIVYGRVKVAF